MGKTFVIGDIHGGAKALTQVLERSDFNNEEDRLITLGDYVDGWSETYEVIEILLGIKNRISILGNHDEWFKHWMTKGVHPVAWAHGGYATAQSYAKQAGNDVRVHPVMGGWTTNLTLLDIPKEHIKFFNDLHLYYVDEKNRCFVHGGFDRDFPIAETKAACPHVLYWDRNLWYKAMSCVGGQKLVHVDNFDEIYIGHTSTINWQETYDHRELNEDGSFSIVKRSRPCVTPMSRGGITNMDTGSGWKGKLTLMNIDSREYWQSDPVDELYKDERGRN